MMLVNSTCLHNNLLADLPPRRLCTGVRDDRPNQLQLDRCDTGDRGQHSWNLRNL